MFRTVERPRVAVLLVVVAVLIALVLSGLGVMVGKASVDDRPTQAQLKHQTTAATAAQQELATVKTNLTTQVTHLEKSVKSWRSSSKRAKARVKRWRKRAHRAERRKRKR